MEELGCKVALVGAEWAMQSQVTVCVLYTVVVSVNVIVEPMAA